MNISLFFRQLFSIFSNTKQRKSFLLSLSLMLLFFAMLLFPKAALFGAKQGLLLWFHTVLPTLFPFIFLCNFCMETGTIRYMLHLTSPLLCRFFHVTPYGSFAVLTGFLCGYPMGSKMAADLYRHGHISKSECSYLVSFCNNTSPMFVISFLVMQNFKNPALLLPTLIILFLSPVLISFLLRPFYHANSNPNHENVTLNPCQKDTDETPLDRSISDALESITKVGAYIILFSVLKELLNMIPFPTSTFKTILLSSLEITQGITLICESDFSEIRCFFLCLCLTSFGGLCAAAQTQSMLKGTGISFSSYLTKKLVTALVTSLFAFLYIFVFLKQ